MIQTPEDVKRRTYKNRLKMQISEILYKDESVEWEVIIEALVETLNDEIRGYHKQIRKQAGRKGS